jgi:hypothetical protein
MPEVAIDSSNLIDHLQRDSLVAIALLNGPIPLTVFAGMDLARELVLFQTLMLATPEHRRELAKVVARLTKGYPSEGVSSESLQSENARLRFDKNKGIAYDHAIACICGYPAPSRGDLINHEDFDKPLKVTRIEWSIRRGVWASS